LDEIVFDYEIPGMSGIRVAREMKALKPTVPILMLSATIPCAKKTKLVEAFLFKANSIGLFGHGQNAIEQMPRCATYVRGPRIGPVWKKKEYSTMVCT